MSGFVTSIADAFLLWYFAGEALSPPSSVWLALSLTTIAADGSNFTELTGTAYARTEYSCILANWTLSGRLITNANNVTLPTAGGPWGTAVDFAYMVDSGASDDMHAFGTLASPLTIDAPQTIIFRPGDLVIRSLTV